MANKKFRLIDAILSVITVVFVAEAVAPRPPSATAVLLVDLPHHRVFAAVGGFRAGHHLRRRGRPVRLGAPRVRRQVGQPRELVLLDQLPAVDGVARFPVPDTYC